MKTGKGAGKVPVPLIASFLDKQERGVSFRVDRYGWTGSKQMR